MAKYYDVDLVIENANEIITCGGPALKAGDCLKKLGVIENGVVICHVGLIVWVGEKRFMPQWIKTARKRIDASGKVVMPGFVDPHTHLVFAGSREDEWMSKLQGVSYLEILKQGGGILSTVEKTRTASVRKLFTRAYKFLNEALRGGTTTIEIKSGYGLDARNELKLLRVIRALRKKHKIGIAPTFLGAHAFPKEKSRKEYIHEVLAMIPLIAEERLADFCDVFCDDGAFSLEEARLILEWAKQHGLGVKIHAGEFKDLGGAELAAELGAVSLDHGEHMSDAGAELLAKNKIPVVLMPGVNFHLGTQPANARKLIDLGVPVVLATDFNPGSSPVLSMQLICSLAARIYKMTPEEIINASTINGAYALGLHTWLGSIEENKRADMIILDIPTYRQLPYWMGRNAVDIVIKNGKIVRN